MTVEERAQLREKALKAEPGPWVCESEDYDPTLSNITQVNGLTDIASRVANNDAEYIAAANPQVVLGLLEELERANADLQKFAELLGKAPVTDEAFIQEAAQALHESDFIRPTSSLMAEDPSAAQVMVNPPKFPKLEDPSR